MRTARTILAASLCQWSCAAFAADVDISKLPPLATNVVSFDEHIRPIFERSCVRCHGPEKPKSRFRLDNRESALKGGVQGVAIIPGKSAESPLIHYVAGLVEDMEMPPKGKGDPLTPQQISLLRAWIDQGAKWGTETPTSTSSMLVSPTIQWITVSGNKSVFREQQWRREGFTAGVEQFELRESLDERSRVLVSGRALHDEYRIGLAIERTDLGFVRGGAEEYHKFYSDAGGYYPPFSPSIFSLDHIPRLDIGRAWIDAGLTLPNLPKVTVGYEYQYRQGEKSTLQWGDVMQGTPRRKFYPASKRINEDVHTIKLDASHTIAGVLIEDSFRAEFYDIGTGRQNVTAFTPGAPSSKTYQKINEGQSYFHDANTFRLEKQFTDWLFGSGGYLYSKLDSDAAFQQDKTSEGITLLGRSDRITLERESHVGNVNTLLGPWQGLSVAAGVQSEWTRQKGFSLANETFVSFFDLAPESRTDIDRTAVEESVRLRYTRVPFTTFFADARLQQESIGHNEESFDRNGNALFDFLRRTDASSDLRDWRVGFSTSPWARAMLTAHFREYQKLASFDNFEDATGFRITNGYPAFISSQDVRMDEVEARLTLRATRWLRATLGYKYETGHYWTETDPEAGVSPGGWVFGADQRASTYSIGAVLTPIRRLYWSTTFTYQDTRTEANDNDTAIVAPYRGHVYNVLSSASFALTERTDLHGSYTFSAADYSQDNFAAGLPLGIEYQRHGFDVGISRRWLKTLRTRLQYAFYKYDEPSSGHFTDYTAHAIFATVTMQWP